MDSGVILKHRVYMYWSLCLLALCCRVIFAKSIHKNHNTINYDYNITVPYERRHLIDEYKMKVQIHTVRNGEIRCYCNLPSCVSTGYMCKSNAGRCFSQITDDVSQSKHGCLEHLHQSKHSACKSEHGSKRRGNLPVLKCCKDDMCNYASNFNIMIQVNQSHGQGSANKGADSTQSMSSQEVWFRAATIAVPICGGFILVLLVLVALRVLKKDSKRAREAARIRQKTAQHQQILLNPPENSKNSPRPNKPLHNVYKNLNFIVFNKNRVLGGKSVLCQTFSTQGRWTKKPLNPTPV